MNISHVTLAILRIGKRFLKYRSVILFFVSWSIAKTFSRNLQIHCLNAKFLFAIIPKKSTVTPRLSEVLEYSTICSTNGIKITVDQNMLYNKFPPSLYTLLL